MAKNVSFVIYGGARIGPKLGNHDINIIDKSNTNIGCSTNLGLRYHISRGNGDGRFFLSVMIGSYMIVGLQLQSNYIK
jgi:hypothetical protein